TQPASAPGPRALGNTPLTAAAAVAVQGPVAVAGQRIVAAPTGALLPAPPAGQPTRPSPASATAGQATSFGPASAQPAGRPWVWAAALPPAQHAASGLSARQPSTETVDLLLTDLGLPQEALTTDLSRRPGV